MLQRTCLAITKGRGADAYMLAIGIHVDLDDLELKASASPSSLPELCNPA